MSEPTKTELEIARRGQIYQGRAPGLPGENRKSGRTCSYDEKEKRQEEAEKEKEKKKDEEFRKEFDELPLEKKIAALVELETVALGETFSFMINSPL